MKIDDIKLLLTYSETQLYVLIGMELSDFALFDIEQTMKSDEMTEYERAEKKENRHTKDFISIVEGKKSKIDMWFHLGKSWYSKMTKSIKAKICGNKRLRTFRKNESVGIVLEIADIIRECLSEPDSYKITASAILLARKGLNIFCKDFDENNR